MPDPTPFTKVSSGQPTGFPLAAEHNAFIDAAQWVKAHQQGLTHGTGSDARCSGIVRVRNDSGGALDRFAAVALRAPIILPTANQDAFCQEPLFTGETPSMPADAGRTAVLLEPATASGAGQIVRAVVSGATVAMVDVQDADHRFAALKDGECVLESAASGDARILWKAGDSGNQLALLSFAAQAEPALRITSARLEEDLKQLMSAKATTWPGEETIHVWDRLLPTDDWSYPEGSPVIVAETREELDGDGNPKWYVISPPLVAKTPITDFRVDGDAQTFDVKTTEVLVIAAKDESGWTTKHTGTTCDDGGY